MPSTIAAGQTEADVLHSLGSFDDQTARQFGLQAQTSGTSSISSSICIVTPEQEEPTGVATIEMRLWENAKVKDSSPQELWKYSTHNFRVQLHALAPAEVHKAVQTLSRYAHERVRNAANVQKDKRRNPSTITSGKTQYRH